MIRMCTEQQKSEIKNQFIRLMINPPIKVRQNNISCHVTETFKKCSEYCLDFNEGRDENRDYIFEISSVLDYLHEELNTGHWSEISIETRQNFTIASIIKALFLLEQAKNISVDTLSECLKCLDMGLLLGAPLEEKSEMLSEDAKCVRVAINKVVLQNEVVKTDNVAKRKFDDNLIGAFEKILGQPIEELDIPSIETFNKKYFVPQIPVKIKGCMSHWPASTKWLDLNYLLDVAGNRTVPVEIGSHYTDEEWSQKLMTLKEFITKHYLSETGDVGYLAQHNLFDQITELKEDIRIPEYCCCSLNYEESTEPDINAWFGPKGTVSPLHQDPKNNILAQVYGTKQLLLYSPEDTNFLYPHDEKMLSNTAQVDPLNPNESKFPNFKKAKMYKCLLEPGEMLFIPVKWWHHVTALEKSFSVSFWWQ